MNEAFVPMPTLRPDYIVIIANLALTGTSKPSALSKPSSRQRIPVATLPGPQFHGINGEQKEKAEPPKIVLIKPLHRIRFSQPHLRL